MKLRIDIVGDGLFLRGNLRESWILGIVPSGKLKRETGISSRTGLCLDRLRRIEIEREEVE